jgi:hypothetical protein
MVAKVEPLVMQDYTSLDHLPYPCLVKVELVASVEYSIEELVEPSLAVA